MGRYRFESDVLNCRQVNSVGCVCVCACVWWGGGGGRHRKFDLRVLWHNAMWA